MKFLHSLDIVGARLWDGVLWFFDGVRNAPRAVIRLVMPRRSPFKSVKLSD